MLFVQRTLFVSRIKQEVVERFFEKLLDTRWMELFVRNSFEYYSIVTLVSYDPRYRFSFVPLLLYYCILTFLSQILELKRRWNVFSPSPIFFFAQFQQNDLSNVKKWKNGKELIDSPPPPPPSSDDSPRAKSFPDISRWKWRGGWRARATEVCVRGEETSPARSSNVRGMSDA